MRHNSKAGGQDKFRDSGESADTNLEILYTSIRNEYPLRCKDC